MKNNNKKIIILLVVAIILMLTFSVLAYAEDGEVETTINVSTVYERAVEWWNTYEDEITSLVSLGATALFGFLISKIKTGLKELISKNGLLANVTSNSSNKVDNLVVAYNHQVDEMAILRQENADLKVAIDEVIRELAAVRAGFSHTARILTTVYTNNKALPQGVRDMVNLECAQCMKLAGADSAPSEETHEHIEKNEG